MSLSSGSGKTKRIFQIILAAFFLIALRVWHLEVFQKEEKLKQAERPKNRTLVLKADRGTICDRFQIPLAVNKICYKASIYYNQIAQIPAISWREDPSTGKRVRVTPRRDYIRELSIALGSTLNLDPAQIEDLIHAKASLFPQVPFAIKSFLSEEEHYRLSAMEKDWLGIHSEISSERFYPKGRVGCEILGTMGSISTREYLSIASEIESLQTLIQNWEMGLGYELPPGISSLDCAARRLQELKEKSYTIQDMIGKSGIEEEYEPYLRGFYGKKVFEVDQKGKLLRELQGGRDPTPGHQITLSISAELQEFAERLLAQDEIAREGRSIGFDSEAKERRALKQPWIKGGSIVVLDPNNGEVLAMASTPRFDPNDFTPSPNEAQRQENICRWLENERAIAAIWDGHKPMVRERYSRSKGFFDEESPLTWELYLSCILPQDGPLKAFFSKVDDVKSAILVQEDFDTLLFHSGLRDPAALLNGLFPHGKLFEDLKQKGEAVASLRRIDGLFSPLATNGDRLFALELCRLVVHAPAFSDHSIQALGSTKLNYYRQCNQQLCRAEAQLKEQARISFRKNEFSQWRDQNQKEFLAQMRQREKEEKRAARPFTDYLEKKEKELFETAWKERRLDLLLSAIPESLAPLCSRLSKEDAKAVLHTFRSYRDLERPLLGNYRALRKKKEGQTEKELAAAFYPIGGFGFSRSYAYQAASPQGSIFKLVTGYAALQQSGGINPLTLIDEVKTQPFSVASSLSGVLYPRSYKGGRLPKSHSRQIGRVDLIGALEQSSNPYFSILAGDFLKNPEDLTIAARLFGYGSPTHIDLPRESAGNLPNDLSRNKTGLYSTAIGQHTLLSTPIQTAVALAAIANGGKILKPVVAKQIFGPVPNRQSHAALASPHAIGKKELQSLGIDFSLFTARQERQEVPVDESRDATALRKIDLPSPIRAQLLEGMDRTVWSSKGTARPGIIRGLLARPELMADFLALRHQMIGKTSTSEILFNPNANPSSRASMYKHIWFGSIAFEPGARHDKPELVVVVYLRYGDGGKEAAPLASQIIAKWRQIKQKQTKTSEI